MSALQYIVVRGDLNWPLGAIIAQGCHACVAAIAKNLDTENTKNYLNKLESMHKVVLKAENEQQLLQLSSGQKRSLATRASLQIDCIKSELRKGFTMRLNH
ncbi:peptidyl-tRNA hydrolase PTRHD1-like protein [Dinothrombium tinctorium]|uniref:peptidyl-tRNA hydrolase n=1 Tax=Dinothrombium tinctorium TaxID=1965070 RepID=A0A443QVM6_9ACAR|nr:peptidyl-tRNA hydrolase PTRHD1-like protein [Dinothrombium tinctorium]